MLLVLAVSAAVALHWSMHVEPELSPLFRLAVPYHFTGV